VLSELFDRFPSIKRFRHELHITFICMAGTRWGLIKPLFNIAGYRLTGGAMAASSMSLAVSFG
jgi:hypothetical protein